MSYSSHALWSDCRMLVLANRLICEKLIIFYFRNFTIPKYSAKRRLIPLIPLLWLLNSPFYFWLSKIHFKMVFRILFYFLTNNNNSAHFYFLEHWCSCWVCFASHWDLSISILLNIKISIWVLIHKQRRSHLKQRKGCDWKASAYQCVH